MEKLNKKTLSFPSHVFAKAVAALTLAMTLAACGNGGGGSNNYGGIDGCQNCGGITAPVAITSFSAITIGSPTMELQNMTLFVDGNYFTPGMSSIYNLYYGAIAAQGILYVPNDIIPVMGGNPSCIIPRGSYPLHTVSMGNINRGSNLVIPDMVAGPMRLSMNTKGSGISELNPQNGISGAPIRWSGTLEVIAVNGYSCPHNFLTQ